MISSVNWIVKYAWSFVNVSNNVSFGDCSLFFKVIIYTSTVRCSHNPIVEFFAIEMNAWNRKSFTMCKSKSCGTNFSREILVDWWVASVQCSSRTFLLSTSTSYLFIELVFASRFFSISFFHCPRSRCISSCFIRVLKSLWVFFFVSLRTKCAFIDSIYRCVLQRLTNNNNAVSSLEHSHTHTIISTARHRVWEGRYAAQRQYMIVIEWKKRKKKIN